MPDVRMPDGTIIANVPEGTTQQDLLARFGAFQTQSAEADIPIVSETGEVSFAPGGTGGVSTFQEQARVDPLGFASAVASGVNRGAVAVADLPFNLINILGNVLGVEKATATPSELIDRVSDALIDFKPIEAAITPTAAVDAPPEIFAGRVAEELGAGGAFGGLARRGAALLTPAVQTGAETAAQGIARNISRDPAFLARETQAAAGGGIGAAAAQQIAPGSTGAEIAGLLGGGVASQIPGPVRAPFRAAQEQLVEPFTVAGARKRVSEILVEQTADPELAVRNIAENSAVMREVLGDETIPTTLLAQDPGLERAVRAIAVDDARILGIIGNAERRINERLLGQLDRVAPRGAQASETIAATERTIANLTSRLDDQITLAKDQADKLAGSTATGALPEQQSIQFQEALQSGFDNSKKIEKKIWGRVDKVERIDLTPLKAQLGRLDISTSARPIDTASIPKAQFQAAKKLPTTKGTMASLADYRSNILQARRQALSLTENNPQKAAILADMERKVASFIDSAGTSPQYRAAANYTRTLHENYTRGKLGRILGIDKTGAETIDPESALATIVRPQGEGAARAQDVLQAQVGIPGRFPGAPGLTDPIEAALKDKFADLNTPKQRNKFIKDFGPILRKFPELSKNLDSLTTEIDILAERAAQLEGRKATVLDSKRVAAAALVGADPDRLGALLSRLPRKDLQDLNKLWARDGVQEGAQAAVAKEFFNAMESGGFVKGGLTDLLKDTGRRLTFDEILTPAQQQSLRAIDSAAQIMRAASTGGKLPDVRAATKNSVLMSLIAKAAASRMGTFFASGQNALIVAGAAARAGKDLADRLPAAHSRALLEKAIVDPDLMADLLNPTVARNAQEYEAILRGHLASAGIRTED